MIRSLRLLACLLLIGTLAACSSGTKDKADKAGAASAKLPHGWQELTKPGFTEPFTAAAYFARPRESAPMTNEAMIAFIKADGSVQIEKVAPMEHGVIRALGGRVGFDSEKDTFDLNGADSSAYRRGSQVGTGHWATITPSGWDISMINVGHLGDGYLTDVFSHKGAAKVRNRVRDVPGAAGVHEDTAYLMTSGSSNADGTVTVYSIDVTKPDSTQKLLEFQPFQDAKHHVFNSLSDLHWAKGSLWFTYFDTPVTDQGQYLTKQRSLRLGRLDLATKAFTSTELTQRPYILGDGPVGMVPISTAGLSGHVFENRLYTIDTAGKVISIDLDKPELHDVAMLSDFARGAYRVAASWQGDQLTLLELDGVGGAKLETYSLRDGKTLASIDVPELGKWFTEHIDIAPWSLTALPGRSD